jgi:hypothetical protein
MRLEDPGTTGSWPVPPVWALVEGAQAASAVWSVMDRWSYPMSLILPGQFLGRRWWLMAAAIELPVPGQVLDVAARADHALLVGTSTPGEGAGGQAGGPTLVVHTRIDGTWHTDTVAADGPVPEVVQRVGRLGPGRVGGPKRRRVWYERLPLDDVAAGWLRGQGWPVTRDLDPIRSLPGTSGEGPNGIEYGYLRWAGPWQVCHSMCRWTVDILAPEDGSLTRRPSSSGCGTGTTRARRCSPGRLAPRANGQRSGSGTADH